MANEEIQRSLWYTKIPCSYCGQVLYTDGRCLYCEWCKNDIRVDEFEPIVFYVDMSAI